MIATCAVDTVPYAWVEQARPGAVILTPWGTEWENTGLLRLTVDPSGESAEGRIVDWATFMMRRQQRLDIRDEPEDFEAVAERGTVPDDVDLADFLSDDARFAVGLRVPYTRRWLELNDSGYLDTLWLLAPGAWASVCDDVVRQAGSRRLWDEAVAGYHWWRQVGKPSRGTYQGTVTAATGQTVWLSGTAVATKPET